MTESFSFEDEALRLSIPSARIIDGQDTWVNAGAVSATKLDIVALALGLHEASFGQNLEYNLTTNFIKGAIQNTSHRRYRFNRDRPERTEKSMNPAHITEEVRNFHQRAMMMASDLPLQTVTTVVTLAEMSQTSRNRRVHIDSPLTDSTDQTMGKILLIAAFPRPTEFLIDGYTFLMKADQLTDSVGTLHDESKLADYLKPFEPDDITLFGARTTMHCEPRHPDNAYGISGKKRIVAKTHIDFDLKQYQ